MIAFQVSDMLTARCAGVVTKALKAVDHRALVRVDLATFTVEIEPSSATARQLSDAKYAAGLRLPGMLYARVLRPPMHGASGRITVLRIVCAQDMGVVVNPQGARMQIEGGLTMGLGYTVSEELQFRGGEILDRNFDSDEIPRLGSVPRVTAIPKGTSRTSSARSPR